MGGAQLVLGVSRRTLRPQSSGNSTWSTRPISFGISDLLRETASKRCGETGRAFTAFALTISGESCFSGQVVTFTRFNSSTIIGGSHAA